jgi:hypothetical protein
MLRDKIGGRTGSAAVQPDDSWVVIGGTISSGESRMAKGSLDSSNIPAMVLPLDMTPQTISALAPVGYHPVGGEEDLIMVPREYHEEAVLVLKAVLGEDFGETEAELL